MNTAPLTEARDRLSEIIDEVETTGTEWVITRHGRAVAVVLNVDEYESLVESLNVLSDSDSMAAIAEAREDVAEGRVNRLEEGAA